MKKVILALVFAVTTFALVGCGGGATTAGKTETKKAS